MYFIKSQSSKNIFKNKFLAMLKEKNYCTKVTNSNLTKSSFALPVMEERSSSHKIATR